MEPERHVEAGQHGATWSLQLSKEAPGTEAAAEAAQKGHFVAFLSGNGHEDLEETFKTIGF